MNDAERFGLFCGKISDTLLEHYEALMQEAQSYLFSWDFKPLDWLPDTAKWSIRKKTAFASFMPFIIFDTSFNQQKDIKSHTTISIIVIWFSYFWLLYFLAVASLNKLNSMTQQSAIEVTFYWSKTQLILFLVCAIFGLIPYIQTFWGIFKMKVPLNSRLTYIAIILITGYIVCSNLTKSKLLPTNFYFSNSELNTLLFFSIAIFWIPFTLLIATLVFALGRLLVRILYKSIELYTNLFSITSSPFINYLMFNIFMTRGINWNLISLPIFEITTLKEWAKSNLEITEKKTLPITILIAALTLAVTFSPSSKIIINTLTLTINYYLDTLGRLAAQGDAIILFLMLVVPGEVVLFTTTITIMVFLKYIRLFGNFFVQGIIVEACTVAEYCRVELEKTKNEEMELLIEQNQRRFPWQAIFDWFFGKS